MGYYHLLYYVYENQTLAGILSNSTNGIYQVLDRIHIHPMDDNATDVYMQGTNL